ncbi:CotH kinase family protein [Mucilaginibacter myungsuensis]|uniref:CotH kinase family protein n=1 Tax=Mucilaginibacter myungsuensis TaxID=649104 RepID=A0A929KVF6_9SPHI|nr:CotH kinase family protein [Mucilaginibacter myungsuensis]MBE9660623.1 CotH kinase family protein [Mucilaginibacter myungsuensis]MDN3600668.1 CotH kinase family protein [Mucilaginibacter myungsuensis]
MKNNLMRNHFLLFITFVLAFTGCKKSTIEEPTPGPTKNDTVVTNPPTPTTPAHLKGLKINGADCAFDSTFVTFYYPVAVGTTLSNITINFDTTAAKNFYFNGTKVSNGGTISANLQTDQKISVKAADKDNNGPTYDLVITGLPIVMLTAGSTIGDNEISGGFKLVNPDYIAQKSQLQLNSAISIAIRGATSRAYPKKNYKVKTTDDAGTSLDKAFLGLREDNSWILDAMYVDQGRMRNRVCTDLWNTFNNVPHFASEPEALNGTRGYMTEVFLNGRYAGVYCLTEKLDRKQLKLKKQYGNSYKANLWTNETSFYGNSDFDNTKKEWGGWELEYPDLGDTPAPNWGYLHTIVEFIANSTDDEFSAHIGEKVDLPNIVDYFIFMNAMVMHDNENKNTFFSFYDLRNANKFFYSVWDMDGALGRNAGGGKTANQVIGASNNKLFQRLLQLDPKGFKDMVKARWNVLKANKLSPSAIDERVENYRKKLVETKAIDREKKVWTNLGQDLNTEAEYMKSWYGSQFTLINDYFNSL